MRRARRSPPRSGGGSTSSPRTRRSRAELAALRTRERRGLRVRQVRHHRVRLAQRAGAAVRRSCACGARSTSPSTAGARSTRPAARMPARRPASCCHPASRGTGRRARSRWRRRRPGRGRRPTDARPGGSSPPPGRAAPGSRCGLRRSGPPRPALAASCASSASAPRLRCLRDLGALYEAARRPAPAPQIGITGWIADFPDPASFLRPVVSCEAYVPRDRGEHELLALLRPQPRRRDRPCERRPCRRRSVAAGRAPHRRRRADGAAGRPSLGRRHLAAHGQRPVPPVDRRAARPDVGPLICGSRLLRAAALWRTVPRCRMAGSGDDVRPRRG